MLVSEYHLKAVAPLAQPRAVAVAHAEVVPAAGLDLVVSRPVAHASRLGLIDELRGLYLTWMICAHAMTLAMLPASHPLQLLRPRGWATTGFLMLTGFALAVSHAPRGLSASLAQRLYRRGVQIAIIAVVSNIAFLLLRALVNGPWSAEEALAIVSLRTTWSISAILLPTAALLALAPWLLRATARAGAAVIFAAALALTLLFDIGATATTALMAGHPVLVAMTGPEYFSFSLPFLLRLGIFGFALGALIGRQPKVSHAVAACALGLTLIAAQSWLGWMPSLIAEARLLVVLGAVRLVGLVPGLTGPRRVLARLGRSALAIFLVHRIVVQAGAHLLRGNVESAPMTLLLIVGALIVCIALTYVRERRPAVGDTLKSFGL